MMHRVIRSLSFLLCAASLLPASALAQQSGPYPNGITVIASGTAQVTDWVEQIDLRYTPPAAGGDAYEACKGAVAHLSGAMHDAGLPESALVTSAVEYVGFAGGAPTPVAFARLRLAPADLGRVVAAVTKDGWRTSGTPDLQPRDPVAAADAAYRAALVTARARAEAIAAADGRHVGKLLNVQPGVTDYLGSMMTGLTALAQTFGRGLVTESAPQVTQTGTFTFELAP